MSKYVVRWPVLALPILPILLSSSILAQSAPKPMRASEVMAIEAGGALQENISHDVAARGLSFHPDSEFLALMTKAGATPGVVSALKSANVTESAPQHDKQLLQQISDAAVMMKNKQYSEAADKLSSALDASFARMETGFVMAELMQFENHYDKAVAIYAEILQSDPDFPEVHNKASYALYRLDDDENALAEARTALDLNHDDAEAHMNAALALSHEQHFDAAIPEFREALRLKPDYAAARSGFGLLYYRRGQYKDAVAEYEKAISLDPEYVNAHNNLGLAYLDMGEPAKAVPELREAKRLDPYNPEFRQNLASALMKYSPLAAIAELKELETKFPDFAVCHFCLGNALLWQDDLKGAEQEYQTANRLDPADAGPIVGLGNIQEKQKNYDAALELFRKAERIAPDDPSGFKGAGRILIAKKDFPAAAAELKSAESAAPSDSEVHELYGQALQGTGQFELAVGEFKEAVALDEKEPYLATELGHALEKKGDWVAALEQYRKAVLEDAAIMANPVPGFRYRVCGKTCTDEFTAAKARFSDYATSLKTAGKTAEATELEQKVAALDTSAGTKEKAQLAIKAGDRALKERNFDEAEKQYKDAVQLSENLPPGDDIRISAVNRLGNAYAMQQNYAGASAMFHQMLSMSEQAFGHDSDRSVPPLLFLGQLAQDQKNYKEAESYLLRGLAITTRASGDNDPRAINALRVISGLHIVQGDFPTAEMYLLRAVKGAEAVEPDMVLIPLWGLCDTYDRAGDAAKSQPCWHRATDLMAERMGQNSPELAQSMTKEATALRKLGHTDEALKIEQKAAVLQNASSKQ